MTYPRYIKRKGRIYGPYYYKSVRDAKGNVLSVYVGRKPPESGRQPSWLLKHLTVKAAFAFACILAILAFGIQYTSFLALKENVYTQAIDIAAAENMRYQWVPNNPGDLTSFRISGSFSGIGTSRVYLKSKQGTYLVFDSSRIELMNFTAEESLATGFLIEENEADFSGNLSNDMAEDAAQQKENLTPTEETASGTPAPQNETTPGQNVTFPEEANLKEIHRFYESCIDTCAIGLPGDEYTLLIEVENGTVLSIDSAIYTTGGKKNNPPELAKEFPEMETYPGGSITINLSEYFSDPEGDELSFDFLPHDDLRMALSGAELSVFTPEQAGIFTAVLNTTDGKDFTLSSLQLEVLPERPENLELEKEELERRLRTPVRNLSKREGRYSLEVGDERASARLHGVASLSDISGIITSRQETIRFRNKDTRLSTPIIAAEIHGLDAAEITLEKTGQVTSILECPGYDFLADSCPEWLPSGLAFSDNGTHVAFTVTHFSGYAGSNLTILDVHSNPQLGGNWTVRFTTIGKANLTITATRDLNYTPEYTRWSNHSEDPSLYDLRLLEIRCGDQSLAYQWLGDNCSENECSALIPDYECSETGYETSMVLTGGRHVLLFSFGEETAYAYNAVYTCDSCTACSEYLQNDSMSSGDTLQLTADLANQNASETCISFGGKDNLTFDCLGNTIDGDDSGTDYGIWLNDSADGSNNNTIRNCVVTDFYYGIYIYYSSNNTLQNTTSTSNYHGLYLDSSSNNTLRNINITTSSNQAGLYTLGYSSPTYYRNDIDNSVAVDGRPVQYFDGFYKACPDSQVLDYNSTYSQVTLVGCLNVTLYATEITDAIYLYNTNNSRVYNVNSSSNFYGLYLDSSSNNTLQNITASSNANYGIYLSSSNNNTLQNITAISNAYGLYLFSSSNNTIVNTTASHNTRGVYFFSLSQYNSINNSRIENNTNQGIYLDYFSGNYPSYNTLYNNYLNNSVNLYSDNVNNLNYWNITKTAGTNIIGGNWIAGNYWTDPDGGNFSDGCTDSDSNGICDTTYSPQTNNTDYIPLAQPYPCVNLSDTSTWHSISSVANRTYFVYGSVNLCQSSYYTDTIHPFFIINNSDVTLDCNHTTISNTGLGTGILSNKNNTQIRNCMLQNFSLGISILDINDSSNPTEWNWTNQTFINIGFEVDSEGNYVLVGIDYTPGNYQWSAIKLYPNGTTAWSWVQNPSTRSDSSSCIAVDQDGNYIIGGSDRITNTEEWRVVKLYPNGTTAWNWTQDPSDGDDSARAIAVDQDGNYIIGGLDATQWRVVKLYPNGTTAWNWTQDPSTAYDYINSVAVDHEGNYVVAGRDKFNLSYYQIRIVKIYPNGTTAWNWTHNPTSGDDVVYSVAVDHDGNYVAGGSRYSTSMPYSDMQYVVKLYPNGTMAWNWSQNPSDMDDKVSSVAVDQDGNCLLLSDEFVDPGNNQWRLVKIYPNGTTIWNWTQNPSTAYDSVLDIGVDQDGNYVLQAFVNSYSSVLKISPSKQPLSANLSSVSINSQGATTYLSINSSSQQTQMTNLTLGYNQTAGKIAFDSLSVQNGTLARNRNIYLDPHFVSLDSSFEYSSVFNRSANVTLYKSAAAINCSNLVYYRKSGFPTSRIQIYDADQSFAPSYISCSDATNLTTFQVESFSGYTTGSDNLYPRWSENYTSGTAAGSWVLHSAKWTEDEALSGYIFSFCNGYNTTWQNLSSDRESGTVNYTAGISTSVLSTFNETWDDGNDAGWTDSGTYFAPLSGTYHSASYSEEYGGATLAYLTKDAAVDMSGKANGNVTWWVLVETGVDDGEYCCLDLSPDGSTWYNGTIDTGDCGDGDGDTEGSFIQLYRTLNSTFMVSTFKLRFRCYTSGSAEDLQIDDINVTYNPFYTDTNQSYTNYSDVFSGTVFPNVSNITVTINVSAYNNSGSAARGNSASDLLIEMYNGTGWAYIGEMDITGTGNFSKSTEDPGTLLAWVQEGNRDLRLKAIYMDYINSSYFDHINYSELWVRIDSTGDLVNDSWVPITGTLNWSNVTKQLNSTVGANISWRVYANNSYGFWNSTSVFAYTTTAADTTPPSISWNTPSSNNSATQNVSWIYWNVSLSETPGSCYLNLNGTGNSTMSVQGLYCYLNTTSLTNQTTYCGRVYANDSAGNLNLSSEMCVTVNLTSNAAPQWSQNSTNSTFAGTHILHSVNWADDRGLSGYIFQFCNGSWNGSECSAGFVNDSWAPFENSINEVVRQDTESSAKINDESAPFEMSWNHTVENGPNLLLIAAFSVDAPNQYPTGVTYNGDAMELVANQASPAYGSTSVWRLVNPDVGSYSILGTFSSAVYAAGGSVSFANVNQTAPTAGLVQSTIPDDSSPVTLNITTLNGDYTFGVIGMNHNIATNGISTSQGASEWLLDSFGGASECTGGGATRAATYNLTTIEWTHTADSGSYIGFAVKQADADYLNEWSNVTKWVNSTPGAGMAWRVYANDSDSQWNSTDIFSYTTTEADTTPPNLWFTSPSSNGSTVSANWLFINVSASETLDTCLLDWNNGSWTNVSMTEAGQYCYANMTGLTIGSYYFHVYGNDTEGNLNVTEDRQAYVNTSVNITWVPPTPDSGNVTANNWAYLNATVSASSNTSAFFDWNYSLVGYWSFDHYNSSGVFDNSTFGNFGTLYGGFGTPNSSEVVATDNFNRADGNLGSNWTNVSGTFGPVISSNKVDLNGEPTGLHSAYWSASNFSNDQYAQAKYPNIPNGNYGPAVAVRLADSRGYILWWGNSPDTVSIWRMDSSSSWTELENTGGLTILNTDVWRLEANGPDLKGYQNGNLVVETTDTTYTGGSPGMWLYYNSNQLDDWEGGNLNIETVSGKFGKALEFDGNDDYVNIPDSASLNVTGSEITVATWIMFHNISGRNTNFIQKNAGGDNGYLMALYTAGGLEFLVYNESMYDNIQLTGPVDMNTWVFVVGTYNSSGQIRIYLDGTLNNSATADIGNIVSSAGGNLYLGYQGWQTGDNYKLDGLMDEVRIWNRALSPEEINASYNNGLYRLYHNFTNLSDGTYNYTAYAIDEAGRLNITSVRQINLDTTPPNLAWSSSLESNNSQTSVNKSFILWNFTSSETIGTSGCKVQVNGTNQTGAVSGLSCYYNETSLAGNQTRCAYGWANDTSNNWNHTEYRCITTNEQQVDTTPPSLWFTSPNSNGSSVSVNWLFINVSASETLDTCLLDWHNGTWTNVSMTEAGQYCYANMTSLAGGSYYFRVYGNDSAGNLNVTEDRQANVTVYTCDSCTACTDYLTNASLSSGDTLKLTADLPATGTCIQFNGKDNVTLDCDGHKIYRTSSGDGHGINVSFYASLDSDYITIQNCSNISYFQYGIYLGYSNYSIIRNTSVFRNTYSLGSGIYARDSGNLSFTGINASQNYYGLYLERIYNSTLQNITSSSNSGHSLYLWQTSNNTLQNITINSNSQRGLFLQSSSNYNTLTDITANNNNAVGVYLTSSSNNTLRNVTINTTSNQGGLYAEGALSLRNDIDNSVTVDGRPVQYFDGQYKSCPDNQVLDYNSTYSQVAFVGCLNVTLNATQIIDSVFLFSTSNSRINNVNSSYSFYGLYLYSSNNNTFQNITGNSNFNQGFSISSSHNNTFQNIIANSNSLYSLYIQYSNNNTFQNTTINSNSQYGLYLQYSSDYNNITLCTITNNTLGGIWLDESGTSDPEYNRIWNNYLNNTLNINIDSGISNPNYFNTTLNCSAGPNIIGGPCIGGNYWTDPDGNFSDTCTDMDNNGICDSDYQLGPNSGDWDYEPLAEDPPQPRFVFPTLSNQSYTQNQSWIYVNVSANETLSSCLLNWVYNNTNQTMSVTGMYCYANMTYLTNATAYYFRVYATDSQGKPNVTENRQITVNLTADTTPPNLWFTSPNTNGSTTSNNWLFINVSASETLNTCLLDWNNGTWTNVSMTPQGSYCYANMTGLTIGSYYFRVYGNDSVGNLNKTADYQATLSTSVNITWVPPTPDPGSTTGNNWVYLNTTTSASSATSAFFDWNHSLTGYWSFEFYNSSGVFDNSTYGNFGTFQGTSFGASNITKGKYGKGLEFDGVDDYVNIPTDVTNYLNMTQGTISFWYKGNGPGTDDYLFAYDNDGDDLIIFFVTDTLLRLNHRADYQGDGGFSVDMTVPYITTDTDWHFVTARWDDAGASWTLSLTHDDATVTDTDNLDVPATYSGTADINGGNFPGLIDEVRIWNRTLSPEEINASYNNGLYRLYHNFTNLSDGDYNYTAYAIDEAGRLNKTEYRQITVGATGGTIDIESILIQPDEGNPGTIINPVEDSNKTANVTVTFTNSTAINTCEIRIFNSSASYSSPVFLFAGTIQNCGAACDCFKAWNMEYWRNDGDWNVSVYINLTTGAGNFTSANFTYNTLTSISVNASTITFSGIPGQTVNSTDAYPLETKNTGNQIVNISIKGTDFTGLSNSSYVVGVGNSTYNETQSGTFEQLTNDFVQIFEGLMPSEARNLFFRAYLPVGFIQQDYQNTIEITT